MLFGCFSCQRYILIQLPCAIISPAQRQMCSFRSQGVSPNRDVDVLNLNKVLSLTRFISSEIVVVPPHSWVPQLYSLVVVLASCHSQSEVFEHSPWQQWHAKGVVCSPPTTAHDGCVQEQSRVSCNVLYVFYHIFLKKFLFKFFLKRQIIYTHNNNLI